MAFSGFTGQASAMSAPQEDRHWASLEETSLLWGIRTLVWIYRHLGRWAFRLILRPVVSYYFLSNSVARVASYDYLRRLAAYYPELHLATGWWLSYRHFLSFGETLLDKIIAWTGCIDPNQVDFPDRPTLLKLIAEKRGAMILSGHIGNLELCQAIAHIRGAIRLHILVHTRHAEKFNRLLDRQGASKNIHLIQVTELTPAVAVDLQDKIDNGEFVVVVGDRIPVQGGRTVKAAFLGEPAEFPQGPYLLASLLRCPIYTLFCYASQGRYRVHLELFAEAIRIPRTEPQRLDSLSALARRYAETLEKHCHAEPLQWFNFYPYWQSAAATTPSDNAEQAQT
jgi:predicted LPLAT superfamily acyltransferase